MVFRTIENAFPIHYYNGLPPFVHIAAVVVIAANVDIII
jgi:hypothetical protein